MSSPNIFYRWTVFLCLSCYAQADDAPSVVINDSFFDGIPIAADAQILTVTVDPKALAHGDADAKLIQYAKPETPPRPDACGLTPSPTVPFTLGCGVTMLALEKRGEEAAYYFLLKARRNEWYQMALSPQSGLTTWVKDPRTHGFGMASHRLIDWLQSQDSYQTAHEWADHAHAIAVRAKPADASEDLTDCATYDDGEGLIPADDKATKGDWLHVTCIENDCGAVNDPQRACRRAENLQKVACVQGWARWRSADGRVTLYPHVALPQGCQ